MTREHKTESVLSVEKGIVQRGGLPLTILDGHSLARIRFIIGNR